MTIDTATDFLPPPTRGFAALGHRRIAAHVGKLLLPIVILALVCLFATGAASLPGAKAAQVQGWNGSGWYLTSPTPASAMAQDGAQYILFNGPYRFQTGCQDAYDRLYVPIGGRRFLFARPAAYAG